MRKLFFSTLMLFVIALPAGAVLTDQEPSNNSIAMAAIQMAPNGVVSSDAGIFTFAAGGGDTDYLGIGGLLAGDIVKVSTTPLNDPPDFESPDTIVGLFTDSGTMVCVFDDAYNNELDQFLRGFGSLCRFEIAVGGDYFVGATEWSLDPFYGNHFYEGDYALTVTGTTLPEPGMLLQLASGLLGLVVLNKRRRSANG